MAETVRVEGLAEVRRALAELPADLAKKTLYSMLRKAAQPIVRAARANAPVAKQATKRVIPGLLKRTLGVRRSRLYRGASGQYGVFITAIKPPGIKRLQGRARKARVQGPNFGDPFYHKFQEAGFHAVGRTKVRGGARRRSESLAASGVRFVPGKNYLGNAYRTQRAAAVAVFNAEFVKASVAAFNRRMKK